MPKLKDMVLRHQNKAGEIYEYKSPCFVDSSGLFTLQIPDDLYEITKSFTIFDKDVPNPQKFSVDLYVHHAGGKSQHRVSGHALENCTKYIRKLIEYKMDCDKVITRVIVYRVQTDYSIWESLTGTLHPNGSGQDNKGKWRGGSSGVGSVSIHEQPVFSIGLAAAVYDKTTYKPKTGTGQHRQEYSIVNAEDHLDPNKNYLERLNSFVGFNIRPDSDQTKEMDYTEEAAKFFYEALMSLCGMALKLDDFFKDEKNIQKAIEGKVKLLRSK
jgi:hypothetical protein